MPNPAQIFIQWLKPGHTSTAIEWLEDKCQQLQENPESKILFTSIGIASRHFKNTPLDLTPEDTQEAQKQWPGLQPFHWTDRECARIALLAHLQQESPTDYRQTIERLAESADLGEQIAIYKSLPLLHFPEDRVARANEGIRSNMNVLFEAVAHYNPFPSKHFSEALWNQMVLKSFFIGSPIYPIYKIDERNNPNLIDMLLDYLEERRAASRTIPVELWRLVVQHPSERVEQKIKQYLGGSSSDIAALHKSIHQYGNPHYKPYLKELQPNPSLQEWKDIIQAQETE